MMLNKGAQTLIETLMGTIMKSLNLDPEAVKAQIGQIGANVSSFKAQLDRLEANQQLILKHLGVSDGQSDERQPELEFAGQGEQHVANGAGK